MSRKLVLVSIMIIVLIGMFCVAVKVPKVKASTTVYIRADGSIDPSTANITTADDVTYTFTDNIYDTIIIEKSNITIDGKGYICQGSGGGEGFTLSSINNVTIINTNITNYHNGVHLVFASDGNTFSNNTITNNIYDGIYLDSSGGNTFSNNTINHNDDGGVRLISSFNNKFSNNILTDNDAGIRLNFASDNNTFSNNAITHNDDGVHLAYSSGNTFSSNAITHNYYDGVHLYSFSSNKFSNNTITNNEYGVCLRASSSNNSFSNNTITNNEYGVHLASSSGNSFYHNIFVFNNVQFYTQSSVNIWDDDSKGNYWDDYGELDTDGDGIGDTPYVIDANNTDRFPLVVPLGPIPVVWDEVVYSVMFMSNSTISRFQFNALQKMISFNVTGQDSTLGFCNLTIPNNLVQDYQ